MTDIHSAQPPRDSRRMLVIVAVALTVVVVALVLFVWRRDGADGSLPGTDPANRQNVPADGTSQAPGSREGGK